MRESATKRQETAEEKKAWEEKERKARAEEANANEKKTRETEFGKMTDRVKRFERITKTEEWREFFAGCQAELASCVEKLKTERKGVEIAHCQEAIRLLDPIREEQSIFKPFMIAVKALNEYRWQYPLFVAEVDHQARWDAKTGQIFVEVVKPEEPKKQ